MLEVVADEEDDDDDDEEEGFEDEGFEEEEEGRGSLVEAEMIGFLQEAQLTQLR